MRAIKSTHTDACMSSVCEKVHPPAKEETFAEHVCPSFEFRAIRQSGRVLRVILIDHVDAVGVLRQRHCGRPLDEPRPMRCKLKRLFEWHHLGPRLPFVGGPRGVRTFACAAFCDRVRERGQPHRVVECLGQVLAVVVRAAVVSVSCECEREQAGASVVGSQHMCVQSRLWSCKNRVHGRWK